ncbi:MAG: hypothetical protein WBG42_03610, partial [Cryomorphaceae bacterium]
MALVISFSLIGCGEEKVDQNDPSEGPASLHYKFSKDVYLNKHTLDSAIWLRNPETGELIETGKRVALQKQFISLVGNSNRRRFEAQENLVFKQNSGKVSYSIWQTPTSDQIIK